MHEYIRYNTLTVCSLILGVVSAAGQWKTESYSISEGLSQKAVLCIYRDRTGFVWFGTWDGLNRFDGNKILTYRPLPAGNNRIRHIAETQYGNIWVTLYDGSVAVLNPWTERFDRYAYYEPDSTVSVVDKIYVSSRDDVWMVVSGSKLCLLPEGIPTPQRPEEYTMSDPMGEVPAHIRFFMEEQPDRFWVGTDNGLWWIVPSGTAQGDHFRTAKAKGFEGAFTACTLYDSVCYFATEQEGVVICDPSFEHPRTLITSSRFGNVPVTTIQVLYDDRLAIGTAGRGLYLYDIRTDRLENYRKETYPQLRNNHIVSLLVDSHGILWITTQSQGITQYDPPRGQFVHLWVSPSPYTFSWRNTHAMECDGHTWVYLKESGLFYYDRSGVRAGRKNQLTESDRVEENFLIRSVLADRGGVLWYGNHLHGAKKVTVSDTGLQPLPFKGKNRFENEIRALHEDESGALWIGTRGGNLVSVDPRGSVKTFDGFGRGGYQASFGMIYGIDPAQENRLWICSKDNGLIRFDPSSSRGEPFVHRADDRGSISSNSVYCVVRDSCGRYWAGTYGGGLNLIVPGEKTLRFIHHANGLETYPMAAGHSIRHMAADRQGRIWLATTQGIVHFDGTEPEVAKIRFSRYVNDGSSGGFLNNDISCLIPDPSGGVWFGTFGGGVGRLTADRGTISQEVMLNSRNGLPSNMILDLAFDPAGNLWIASEAGFSCYNAREGRFEYTMSESFERISVSERCVVCTSDGEIVFGSTDGAFRFVPGNMLQRDVRYLPRITDFQIFDQSGETENIEMGAIKDAVRRQGRVRLRHDHNNFRIEFSALDFSRSDIGYAYRLDGIDDAWRSGGSAYGASYTDIPPGEYTFRVRCSTTANFTDKPECTVRIGIRPPIWKTTTAYILYLAVAAFLLLIVARTVLIIYRLRNRMKLEKELTDYKLQFFTNFSHELITPLTLIISPVDMMVGGSQTPPELRYQLLGVQQNANRMLHMISQILEFRKIQSGRYPLHLRQEDIVELIRQVASDFDEAFHRKSIGFSFSSSPETIVMPIDAPKLEIIACNLLSNALKYTPEGRSISIRIVRDAANEMVEIVFADQGIGIPKAKQEKLFERFYTTGYLTDPRERSTGIGLSLVRELVELHGGTIALESEESNGTVVMVRLPVRTLPEEDGLRDGYDDPDPSPRAGLRPDPAYIDQDDGNQTVPVESAPEDCSNAPVLLVVDDNIALLNHLSDLLRPYYRLHFATDGREGYRMAQILQPDLILSDLLMPHMDGLQMLRVLRENPRTSHILVILLSAKGFVKDRIAGFETGADDYIPKPFRAQYLLSRIDNLLERRRLIVSRLSVGTDYAETLSGELRTTSADAMFLKKVIQCAEDSIGDPTFYIENIARTVGMSRTNFYHKLKSLTGMSPIHFIREIRMQRAAVLLESGEYLISEVAEMVGFSDNRYFTKSFVSRYGITPSSFVKNARNRTEKPSGR